MSRTLRRRLRSLSLYPLVAFLALLFGILPWRTAQALGRRLGALVYRSNRRERERARAHLEIAFPELSSERRLELARASFQSLGTNLAECLHVWLRGAEATGRHIEVEGWHHVTEQRASGKAILILTGHCGNWEIMGIPITQGGVRVSAVARSLDQGWLQKVLVRIRHRIGTETIARGQPGAAKKLLHSLRNREALAMLIDQDTKVDGVWVPFFGRSAFTPKGAAELAIKRNVAVIPSFIERRSDGTHLTRFLPPLEVSDSVEETTARMTAAIELQIRRVPEQWVWMHRRWRRRPPSDVAVDDPDRTRH